MVSSGKTPPGVLLEEEDTFVHREAEEEAKTEIEKDASLMKAYAKIAEWRGTPAAAAKEEG